MCLGNVFEGKSTFRVRWKRAAHCRVTFAWSGRESQSCVASEWGCYNPLVMLKYQTVKRNMRVSKQTYDIQGRSIFW